jgi:aryl-alcohol dehydrogenase-like predicted oxidoreductase
MGTGSIGNNMRYRKLGNSDLTVSVISLGAWQFGDPTYWGSDPDADAQRTLDAALDAGVNFIDTAEMYGAGESERVLGRLLGDRRDRVVLASKVWPDKCAPPVLRKTCEESLRRLNTDFIDLYQIHWPVRDVSFDDVYTELERLQSEGKIRAIGVSNFGPADLDAWMAAGSCVSNQLGYNLLFRAIEFDVLPACRKYGIGVLAYMPLMQGLLAGHWQSADEMPTQRRRSRHFSGRREGTRHGEPGCEDLTFSTLRKIRELAETLGVEMACLAIGWLIAQPDVTSVIVGARKPHQLQRNLQPAGKALDTAAVEQLAAITRPLKDHLGANPDMWLPYNDRRVR